MCQWHKRIFLIITLFFFIPTHSLAMIKYPDYPILPSEDENEKLTMVLVVKEKEFLKAKQSIKQNHPKIKIRQEYETVFKGFSVEGTKKDLQLLLNEPYIEHASPVSTYEPHIEESVPFIGGQTIRGYFDEKDERLTGKGIKIAVIDTGIDYHHPDLHRNYKGGYDVVDGDDDPMESLGSSRGATIHGTHVSGIIAANGKLTGMAPDASIMVYRALGPNGVGTSEQVIAAIEKAVKDKVDIMNLSLGNNVNAPDWPTSLAINKAVEKGIIAVTSSGNSGPNAWTVGSPGTASKAISVGASTPPLDVPYLTLSGYKRKIRLLPLHGASNWDLTHSEDIVYVRLGEKKDFKKSVQGKVVLIKRGKITFTEKVENAKAHGAKAVLIYNNLKGNFIGHLQREIDIPVASISKEDGEWLKEKAKENNWLKTSYEKEEDTLAPFSSRGPVTTTWEIKPDVVAPGVSIDSTIPKGYLSLNGTSMAAPHVAGAAALIKQKHLDWSPEQVKAALMNTAKPLRQEGEILPTYEQGAGRIDVAKAIQADTLIYPASITFGQIHSKQTRVKKKVNLTLDNQSKQEKTFIFLQPKVQKGIQWNLPKETKVSPKQKKKVTVYLDITPHFYQKGIYDGALYVQVGHETIRIPYLFVMNEPDYPRLMGFEMGLADQENTLHYELYLPGGADEFGIALYDPDTLRFIGFLDFERNVSRGLRKKDIKQEDMKIPQGFYKAVIFAKKGNKEDKLETEILVDFSLLENQ